MTDDPLQDSERLECLARLCAFDGDALYEIAWDLWTRLPELRVRSAETTRALAATIERLVTVGALELRWSTWEPHTIGELIPADRVHDVLGTAQWWKPGQEFVTVLLSPPKRQWNRSFSDCLEWRA